MKITRIRHVRRSKKLTLQDVADRCVPPTTPQTIGRLETGMRSVSVDWLDRIAHALEVETGDLLDLTGREDVPIAALLDHDGAHAPRSPGLALAPGMSPGMVAVMVSTGIGDYRSGDQIWCQRLEPSEFGRALNRDVLFPRPGDRLLFGRLIDRQDGRLQILPLGAGQRQTIIAEPGWGAVAHMLIRTL